jgi:streptogramin lyase
MNARVHIMIALAGMALGIGCAAAAEISYFDVPRGAHPHDVAPAPDGWSWCGSDGPRCSESVR